MVHHWEPDTQYNAGSVVEYNGHRYKIIQPHRSQSDWAPSKDTSALWERLKDSDTGGQYQNQNQHQHPRYQEHQLHEQPCSPNTHGYNPPQPVQQSSYDTHPSDEKVEIPHEEQKKHWYDIDDKRKKELEIGGGLLAGAALLTGGYFAYKEHEENKEEKRSLQNWIKDAEARTSDFRENGPRSPATWVLNEGTNIPSGAIEVGQEHDWKLYICRAFHEGSIQIGKASDVFKKGAVIGYKHEEIHLGIYEILVGNMHGLRWVDASGKLDVSSLGHEPVEGGREVNGTPLYIAEARHNGVVHPGKASKELDGAYIPYDGTEERVEQYRVLCYAKATDNSATW